MIRTPKRCGLSDEGTIARSLFRKTMVTMFVAELTNGATAFFLSKFFGVLGVWSHTRWGRRCFS